MTCAARIAPAVLMVSILIEAHDGGLRRDASKFPDRRADNAAGAKHLFQRLKPADTSTRNHCCLVAPATVTEARARGAGEVDAPLVAGGDEPLRRSYRRVAPRDEAALGRRWEDASPGRRRRRHLHRRADSTQERSSASHHSTARRARSTALSDPGSSSVAMTSRTVSNAAGSKASGSKAPAAPISRTVTRRGSRVR
jgi:hypothetical protein